MTVEKTQSKWKWPLIFVGIAATIITVLVLSKPEPAKTEIKEKEWLVSAESLVFSDLSPQLELLGVVQSPFESALSAGISADVLSVPVREGSIVEKGQLLIALDQRNIATVVARSEADVADLNAQITNEKNRYKADIEALSQEKALMAIAEKSLQRQEKLQRANLVAQERYDQAASEKARNALAVTSRELAIKDHPARMAQLQARLARAEAALNEARLDAERTQIRAPFDGVVTEVHAAPGERVQVGQALLSLYDQRAVEVKAQVPDRFITPIRKALLADEEISATTQHYGETSRLKLVRLSGQANRGAGGVDAMFVPADEQTTLVLNSTMRLKVTLPALEHVTSLPVSAIYGTNRIYRVEDGRIRALMVDILGRQISADGPDRILLNSKTIQAGDVIITTQLPNAISGLKVNVKEG